MRNETTAVIREESERFAAALTAADPGQQVPTCPEWTASDLLWHLTEVHEFWAAILAGPLTTEEEATASQEAAAPRPEGREELLARRAAATSALLAQLESREDHEPAWFWYSAEQGVGITRRMQTHEATIHRVDAELTAGRPVTPIPEDVAHAGIEHVLRVMWPAVFEWIPDWATIRPVAVLDLTAEGGRTHRLLISRWSGTRPRDGQAFDAPVGRLLEDPAEADGLPRAAVTGSPTALDLWVWGREAALEHLASGPQEVEVLGDSAAVEQVRALLAEGHD